jgi:Zn-dependent peptidase ImmA (M78 family)
MLESMALDVLYKNGLSQANYRPPTPIEEIVETPGFINIVLTEKLPCKCIEHEGKIWGSSRWSDRYPGERDIILPTQAFESIDPNDRAKLNYTLAHEYFHAIEHLPLVVSNSKTQSKSLFNSQKPDGNSRTAIRTPSKIKSESSTISESTPKRYQTPEEWREWQAEYFAACLLMPRFSLLREFEDRFDTIQLEHPPLKKKETYAKEVARMTRPHDYGDTRSLSEIYCVSASAMAYHLIQLQLVV